MTKNDSLKDIIDSIKVMVAEAQIRNKQIQEKKQLSDASLNQLGSNVLDEDVLLLTNEFNDETKKDNQKLNQDNINKTQDLLSDLSIKSSLNSLDRLINLAQNYQSLSDYSALTSEQFIHRVLNPLLKEWIDKNLSLLVEKIVEREIKKLLQKININ
ncbi:MAG: DUF2497 domain-containing protein [Alphaproteobacteria bacterium]|nr:DUF2497 domain-containing protein [Alphaproteobacteria bacterium]